MFVALYAVQEERREEYLDDVGDSALKAELQHSFNLVYDLSGSDSDIRNARKYKTTNSMHIP